jgi:hypothetical protein
MKSLILDYNGSGSTQFSKKREKSDSQHASSSMMCQMKIIFPSLYFRSREERIRTYENI